MTNSVTLNGNTYTDGADPATGLAAGGHRARLVPMFSDAVLDLAAKQAAAAGSAATATTQAGNAAASATSAVSAPGTNATSASNLTVAMGALALVLAQIGKLYSLGQTVVVASTLSPGNWMAGTITAFNSGTGAMTVNVTNIGLVTAGVFPTLAAWTVSLSGAPGVTGVLNELKGNAIASAAMINLDAATGNTVHITGVIGCNAITLVAGAKRTLIFDGVMTFTNSASLVCPGGVNLTTAAGDICQAVSDGAGVVYLTDFVKKSGTANVVTPSGLMLLAVLTPTAAASVDVLSIFSAAYDNYLIIADGITTASATTMQMRFANAGVADAGSHYYVNGGAASTSIDLHIAASSSGNSQYASTYAIALSNVNSAASTIFANISSLLTISGAGYQNQSTYCGYFNSSVVSGFRLFPASGNFGATGKIRVYGYQNT